MKVGIAIGIGGTGIQLAKAIVDRVRGKAGVHAPVLISLDTISTPDVRGLPRKNHYFLGGFDVQLAASSINVASWEPSDRDRLESACRELGRVRDLDDGAAGTPELGRLALSVHKEKLKSWLSDVMQRSSRASAETIDIILLGSLAGGTAAGSMPELGGIVHEALGEWRKLARVTGVGLDQKSFRLSGLAPSALVPVFAENQTRSLRWLNTEFGKNLGKNHRKSYDTFYVVDDTASRDMHKKILRIADNIAKSWVESVRDRRHMSLQTNDDDGILLLNFSNDHESMLLWGPSGQFISENTPEICSFGVLFHVPTFRLRWADKIENLRRLINDPQTTEAKLQRFFEHNSDFLTGFEYSKAIPQVQLKCHREGDLIPDFMLVPLDGGLADIVELKLPRHKLLANTTGYPRFSSTVYGAIFQLKAYREYFDSEENRNFLQERYGFTTFKPKLSLVIGHSSNVATPLVFRKVAAEHPNVSVITYDEVVAKAQRLLGFK